MVKRRYSAMNDKLLVLESGPMMKENEADAEAMGPNRTTRIEMTMFALASNDASDDAAADRSMANVENID
jgi:hypothetical protein